MALPHVAFIILVGMTTWKTDFSRYKKDIKRRLWFCYPIMSGVWRVLHCQNQIISVLELSSYQWITPWGSGIPCKTGNWCCIAHGTSVIILQQTQLYCRKLSVYTESKKNLPEWSKLFQTGYPDGLLLDNMWQTHAEMSICFKFANSGYPVRFLLINLFGLVPVQTRIKCEMEVSTGLP